MSEGAKAAEWVEWVEPYGPDAEMTTYIRARVSEVINYMHARAKKYGVAYPSDQDALNDFMVVNWAEFCNAPDTVKEKT
jgi:hypothetical protein